MPRKKTTSAPSRQHSFAAAAGRLEEGRLPSAPFTDPEVYELEKERVFRRSWMFLAHESEIARPRDYVVRYLLDDSVIVTRGDDGEVRTVLNTCRHRGNRVCGNERGNASHFICPYHGWTYRNTGELSGVPLGEKIYGPRFDRNELGLVPVPRQAMFHGMIFGSLDPDAPDLEDDLGPMKWYLELLTRRSESGQEVPVPPSRFVVRSNWKVGADNFVGDGYHTMTTHRSAVELGLVPKDPSFGMYGHHVDVGNGHGVALVGAPPGAPAPPFGGYPPGIVASLERSYPSAAHVEVARSTLFMHGTIFPNLSFLNASLSKDPNSMPVPFLFFHLWRPLGPERTEVWTWFFVERDAPERFKRESYLAYVRNFGPGGVFEQDDMENFRNITAALGGMLAREGELNYQMGMDVVRPDPQWPGPGDAYPIDFVEANQRGFHRRWLRQMGDTDR